MQDKYRKLYNENLLGTSDVSILKFYYASFKIQQRKGRVSDVNVFLDECIKVAADTSKAFKILGFIPYVSSKYGTEQQRISKFISLRRGDVAALFLKDDITDKDVEELLYGISVKEKAGSGSKLITQAAPIAEPTKEPLELVKDKILKCYSIRGRKQLGDRIFGYLLVSEIIPAYTPEERLQAWRTFIGPKIAPSDTKLHTTPSLNRSNNDAKILLKHLDSIREFYSGIGLENVVRIIEKDVKNLIG
jgi:hypothetical protein